MQSPELDQAMVKDTEKSDEAIRIEMSNFSWGGKKLRMLGRKEEEEKKKKREERARRVKQGLPSVEKKEKK